MKKIKLSSIFDIARGGSPRPIQDYLTDDKNGINWIMIGDTIEGNKYIEKTAKKIKPSGIKKSRKVYVGDFLLTNSMSFGRPYILKIDGCIHDGWLVLSPRSPNISTDYFYYLLSSQELKSEMGKQAAGAVVKNLNSDIVRNIEVKYPDLPTQTKIAKILDKADQIRQKRKKAIELADEFLRSLFLEMFGDPVVNPKGWEQIQLKDCAEIYTGKTPPTEQGELFIGEIPFITPADLVGIIYSSKRKIAEDGIKYSKYVPKNSTLVCCIGATIGKLGLTTQNVCFNQQINSITWKQSINPIFGYEMMKFFSSIIAQKGASTTLPILKKSEFEKIKIICPSLEIQRKFENVVELVNQKKQKLIASGQFSDELFNSLSQQHFAKVE